MLGGFWLHVQRVAELQVQVVPRCLDDFFWVVVANNLDGVDDVHDPVGGVVSESRWLEI